ncbi:MAG: acyl-phosphate glycerol 3-phosphate acyltransferase [Deltaproteobacteria bacterium]|nr:MAG: acyl-phosphate glycerol 3-phosphate acyltransferase [Deltaproteobacteria bacterium]
MKELLLWTLAYLLGSIPVGILVSEWFKSGDPRESGSGNIGATNLARTAGKKAGLITLGGDCLKGLLAVLLARLFGAGDGVAALAGLAAFVGHLYPIFLNFKGGKGVATALGIFLALAPMATLMGALLFALVTGVSRLVSLGSIAAAITMPLFISQTGGNWKVVYCALIMSGFIIYKHKDNILRLCQNEENRLF